MTSEPFRYNNSENLLLDIHDLNMGSRFCASNNGLNSTSSGGGNYYSLGMGSEFHFSDVLNNKSLSNGDGLYDMGEDAIEDGMQRAQQNSTATGQSELEGSSSAENVAIAPAYASGSVNSSPSSSVKQVLPRQIPLPPVAYGSSDMQQRRRERDEVGAAHADLYRVRIGGNRGGGADVSINLPSSYSSGTSSSRYSSGKSPAAPSTNHPSQQQPMRYSVAGSGSSGGRHASPNFLPVNSVAAPKQQPSPYVSTVPPCSMPDGNHLAGPTAVCPPPLAPTPCAAAAYGICRGYPAAPHASFSEQQQTYAALPPNFKRPALSSINGEEGDVGAKGTTALNEHTQQQQGAETAYSGGTSIVAAPERDNGYYPSVGTPADQQGMGGAPMNCETMTRRLSSENATSELVFHHRSASPSGDAVTPTTHVSQPFNGQGTGASYKESPLQHYLRMEEEKAEVATTIAQNKSNKRLDNHHHHQIGSTYLSDDYLEYRKSKKLNPLTYDALFNSVIDNDQGVREKYVLGDHPKVRSLSEMPGMIYFLFVPRGTRKPPHVGYPFRSYTDSHYTSVDRDTPIICKVKEQSPPADSKNVWRLYHYYLGNKKRTPRKRKRSALPDDND